MLFPISLSGQCEIWDLELFPSTECVGDEKRVEFEYNSANLSGEGLYVYANGVIIDTLGPNDPQEFYLTSACNTLYEIVIEDVGNEGCLDTAYTDDICCPNMLVCEIDINVELIVNQNSITAVVFVDRDSLCPPSFDVFINEEFHSSVVLSDDNEFMISDYISEEETLLFRVCSNQVEDACAEMELDNPLLVSTDEVQRLLKIEHTIDGSVLVQNESNGSILLFVYDMNGRLVRKNSVLSFGKVVLDLSTEVNGLYVLQGIIQDHFFSQKILIMK